MPPRKDTQLLMDIHKTIHDPETGIKKQLDYLMNDMRVNGSVGIEQIMRNTDATLKDIKPMVTEMWFVTASMRAKYEWLRATRELAKNAPFLRRLWKWLFNRVAFIIVIVLIIASAWGISISEAVKIVLELIK